MVVPMCLWCPATFPVIITIGADCRLLQGLFSGITDYEAVENLCEIASWWLLGRGGGRGRDYVAVIVVRMCNSIFENPPIHTWALKIGTH